MTISGNVYTLSGNNIKELLGQAFEATRQTLGMKSVEVARSSGDSLLETANISGRPTVANVKIQNTQSKISLTTPETPDCEGGLENDEDLVKYVRMKKMGVPPQACVNKMKVARI